MRKVIAISVLAGAAWLAIEFWTAPGTAQTRGGRVDLTVLRRIELPGDFFAFRGEPGSSATVIMESGESAILLNPEGAMIDSLVLEPGQILESSENADYIGIITFDGREDTVSLMVQDRAGTARWQQEWVEEKQPVLPELRISNVGPGAVVTRGHGEWRAEDFEFWDGAGRPVNHVDIDLFSVWEMSANGALVATEAVEGVIACSAEADTLWTFEISSPVKYLIDQITFEPCGRYVALDMDDMDEDHHWVILLDGHSGNQIAKHGFGSAELSMAFSPDGEYLVVAEYDKVCLLQCNTGEILWTHPAGGPDLHFQSVSASNLADLVVVGATQKLQGGYSRWVYVLDHSGSLIGTEELEEPLTGRVYVKISSDSHLIAACTDSTIFYLQI